MKTKTTEHKCTKGTVRWNKYPTIDGDGLENIFWYGRCTCGKRVYEAYSQQPEMYDAKTDQQIAP